MTNATLDAAPPKDEIARQQAAAVGEAIAAMRSGPVRVSFGAEGIHYDDGHRWIKVAGNLPKRVDSPIPSGPVWSDMMMTEGPTTDVASISTFWGRHAYGQRVHEAASKTLRDFVVDFSRRVMRENGEAILAQLIQYAQLPADQAATDKVGIRQAALEGRSTIKCAALTQSIKAPIDLEFLSALEPMHARWGGLQEFVGARSYQTNTVALFDGQYLILGRHHDSPWRRERSVVTIYGVEPSLSGWTYEHTMRPVKRITGDLARSVYNHLAWKINQPKAEPN